MNAGSARRNITPTAFLHMAGFDRRKDPANGTLDALQVSALALRGEQGGALVLLGFDLLGLNTALCDAVRTAAAAACGLVPEQIWVSATHTHSAPSLSYPTDDAVLAAYIEDLLRLAAEAAAEAMTSAAPVTPEFADAPVRGLTSLRNRGREGSDFAMPLPVFRLRGKDKTHWLMRICCHPTVLDERNLLYSADIPGRIRAVMGAGGMDTEAGTSGEDIVSCLVLNGACGDLSTRFTRRASDAAELARLGALPAEAALAAHYTPAPAFGNCLRCAHRRFTLARQTGPHGAERTALMAALRRKADACTDTQALREYDSILAVLERPEAAPQQRALCISTAHLGSCILLGSPFEMDHADSVALEALLSDIAGLPVYLICYTGGAESYLPSGAPLTENSTYEDFAALYAPESRQTVWRFAEECVRELL